MDDVSRGASVNRLVEEHYGMVFRFAYRLSGSSADAEDLAQNAFLTVQEKLHQLREPEKVRSWLLTIVRNAYLKDRRGQREFPCDSLEENAQLAVEENIAGSLLHEVDQHRLQQALDELPEEFRSALILFYFEECSYKQMADILDVPIGTVMSRLSRAKSHLRNRLLQQPEAAWMEPAARH